MLWLSRIQNVFSLNDDGGDDDDDDDGSGGDDYND